MKFKTTFSARLWPFLAPAEWLNRTTEDLPEFAEAAAEWIQHRTAKRALTTEQIHAALRKPFPQRGTTCVEEDHVRY
jgi:hypothetical protein